MRDEDEIMSPSMRREWIEMLCLRPSKMGTVSPSMRREWIEIAQPGRRGSAAFSLHAEGVD